MSETIFDEREVLKQEKKYIHQLKGGEHSENEFFGLSISGGGIRSASFALGALQALNNKKLISKLDYMSTVSGGGYIGSCLTWFLDKIYHARDAEKAFSLGEQGEGARTSDKNDVLDFLRQHGKYLIPGNGLDPVSLLGVVLRSMFLGFFVYFPLITLIFWGMVKMRFFDPISGVFPEELMYRFFSCPNAPNPLLVFSIILMLFFAVVALAYSLCTVSLGGNKLRPYKLRTDIQELFGWIIKIQVLLIVIGTMPIVVYYLGEGVAAVTSGSVSLLGALGGFFKLVREQTPQKGKKSLIAEFVPVVAAILLIYGLLLGGYMAAISVNSWWWLALPVLAMVIGYWVNLNYVSLHRMYRDRLMEMFLPDLDAVKNGKWELAKEANTKGLEDFKIGRVEAARNKFIGPFQIINTNLIQIDADGAKYHGRGGDNFILTPFFCGSNATGWCTAEYFNGGTMTLASAMAVSGAAVNPHAGPCGRGATRNWLVSFLMSFLNFRLGYWAWNPAKNSQDKKFHRPNYFCPGIMKGLLGLGFNERSNFIELSDGGHFENLAVYELIRRRVKTIIVTDGGADPDFNFSDLANAVEKVRVDFGVYIDFSKTDKPICDLLPDSAEKLSLYRDKYNLARRGYAVGKIRYPRKSTQEPAFEGTIYYIKSTLTGGLPEDIYGYKSINPTFPDQSTADQFFDETQFEAYRELGYQLTKIMLDENKDIGRDVSLSDV